MLNTGQFVAISGLNRRLIPAVVGITLLFTIALAFWLMSFLPLIIGVACCLGMISAIPTKEDYVSHTLRRRPDLSVLSRLASETDLQRSVFDVAGELVSCVEVRDCTRYFSQALRTYWNFSRCSCWIWERGTWHLLPNDDQGMIDSERAKEDPTISAPVILPSAEYPTLQLDLSPAVSGQAVLILSDVKLQPTLIGHQQRDVMALAEVLRAQLALALRRAILHRDLQSLARIDPLTGVDRRWYGEQRIQELLPHEELAVAMVDIDHFKSINDSFGHLIGDQVLARIGLTLRQQVRPSDLVFRYGGEEFVLVIRGVSESTGQQTLQRVIEAVANDPQAGPPATISAGLTMSHIGESLQEVIKRADQACYCAKRQGRNQLQVS